MKLLKQLFNQTKINEPKLVEVAKIWCVRWEARHGKYSGDTKPVAKYFLSKDEAEAFRKSLIEARRLLQYTESISIELTEE